MDVGLDVQLAIDLWVASANDDARLQGAMLHACIAVDGTARKVYPAEPSVKTRFTTFLRDSYAILGPMGAPGIDLVRTRFPVELPGPATTEDGNPDIADVIYAFHRCIHAHGEPLPAGFELIREAGGPPRRTTLQVERGRVRLSDRMVFGLLGAAVACSKNHDQSIPDGYFLSYEETTLSINDWWGRASDLVVLLAAERLPSVTLDFGDWTGQKAH